MLFKKQQENTPAAFYASCHDTFVDTYTGLRQFFPY